MGKKEKVTCLGETVKSADEESVSTEEATDNYEVGYGKPPKNNQFQKGVLGNPAGRPKKPQDFDQQLLREAGSFVIINEKGRRVRISKHDVAIRQLMHKAMAGDMTAFENLCSSLPTSA